MSNTFILSLAIICLTFTISVVVFNEIYKERRLRESFKKHVNNVHLPCHVAYKDEQLSAPDLTFNFNEVMQAYDQQKLFIEAELFIIRRVKDRSMLREFIQLKYGISGTLASIAKKYPH